MLTDILTDIGIEVGETDTDSDRNSRIFRINKAAEELHEKYDLEEGREEKVFNFSNDNSPQIALPPYVFQVRGMRLYDSRGSIELDDAKNRYNFSYYDDNQVWYLKHRRKKDSPLSRDLANQSIIKVSIPIVETVAFTVTITGETDNSYQTSETLSFAIGDLEKQTVANFKNVASISKNIITKYNISFKDVEDNDLGYMLNSEYQSQFMIYQIGDSDNLTVPESTSVEVWYKTKLQPFKLSTDCFLGTSRYDKAIFWMFMSHRSKVAEDAILFREKCGEAVASAIDNTAAEHRKLINFKPQAFLNVYEHGYTRGY